MTRRAEVHILADKRRKRGETSTETSDEQQAHGSSEPPLAQGYGGEQTNEQATHNVYNKGG